MERVARTRRAAWGFGSRTLAGMLSALVVLALSGCLYPEDQTPGNDASARQAVLAVQDAVDRYQEETGLLPIISADESVPVYEKFRIDLGKLKRTNYLGSVPGAAFESGGRYQFLLLDEETEPVVKLLDIPIYQTMVALQDNIDDYMDEHGGQPPLGDSLYPGFWSVDFKKAGGSAPDIRSMYSGQNLTVMADEAGQVYIDYAIDIATAVRKAGITPAGDEDLRRTLVDASYYVPVKSPVYHWADGEPAPQPDSPE